MTKKPTNKRIRVLVYEDDKDFNDIITKALEKSKEAGKLPKGLILDPVIIPNNEGFEEFVENFSLREPFYSFALMDIRIGTNVTAGFSAADALRKKVKHEDCPIIMFSKSFSHDAKESAYAAGATSFVKKPSSSKRMVISALSDILNYWAGSNMENPVKISAL